MTKLRFGRYIVEWYSWYDARIPEYWVRPDIRQGTYYLRPRRLQFHSCVRSFSPSCRICSVVEPQKSTRLVRNARVFAVVAEGVVIWPSLPCTVYITCLIKARQPEPDNVFHSLLHSDEESVCVIKVIFQTQGLVEASVGPSE